MAASHLFYDSTEHDVLTNLESINREAEAYEALSLVAILCSRATFIDGDDVPIDNRITTGDASEGAILKIMERLEGNVEEKRRMYPKVQINLQTHLIIYYFHFHRFAKFPSPQPISIKYPSTVRPMEATSS